jgi:phospholipid/cholesterol/gamma-HCH transport system permease protein
MSTIVADKPPTLDSETSDDGALLTRLSGDWTILSLRRRFADLARVIGRFSADPGSRWDLRNIGRMDSAGAMTLWHAWGLRTPEHVEWSPEQRALFAKLNAPEVDAKPANSSRIGLTTFGSGLLSFFSHLLDVVALAGRLLFDLIRVATSPRLIGWREISANIYRTGAQALAITGLVGFLVGITLSYLIARQLQVYGADTFIVNILGIAVPRELGPLLAAIVVAGRSGSSMTAQLGVMRVTQELDALSVMGISHTVRLVLPKVIALAISLPLVVLWTSAVMLLGGMLAARVTLGIDPSQFLQSLPDAVPAANLWLGWTKGILFGALIALLACHFGLRIKPNTESLGVGVTNSVVTSITVVIVFDAIFAVLFSDVGI